MENGKIYVAIPAVMKAIGVVGKDKTNQTQGFKYRGVEDVMNARHPALVEHGVFPVPNVMECRREERKTAKGTNLIYSLCKVSYTFYAVDGSNVEVTVYGEGMDSGDKSVNKALSAAYKYACFQIFCIPTEEMKDPDKESHEVKDRKINEEEKKNLRQAAERTGMNLEVAIKKRNGKSIDDVPVSVYTQWMIKLANTDSQVPKAPDVDQDIPENIDEGLPFK